MTTVCLLQPLIVSTLSHRVIPGGTLGLGFCFSALDEGDGATVPIDISLGVLVAASFVLLFWFSVDTVLVWTCGEAA